MTALCPNLADMLEFIRSQTGKDELIKMIEQTSPSDLRDIKYLGELDLKEEYLSDTDRANLKFILTSVETVLETFSKK